MKKYVEILSACPLFQGINGEDIPVLLDCLGARVIRVEKGETIFREGEQARDVGLVLSGAVQIQMEDYDGGRTILNRVTAGELFGEAFACAQTAYLPVSAMAAQESQVMRIDCRRITQTCCSACSFHNQVVFNLLRIMAEKNLAFHQKLQILSRPTTREKLMTYLAAQAKGCGSSTFTIPFDRQELADYLGVDRSGLSAEIGKLKAEGVIRCHRSSFTLL